MSFIDVQNEFMAHIREPKKNKKPTDIEDRRMAIYRDLFFNNIEGFISSGYPVLKTLYSDKQWNKLIRQFFSEYNCQSPYFLDIAGEFINYLSSSYEMKSYDPAFMLELAHYEWVEQTALTKSPLFLSSVARNLSYQYPVQTISDQVRPKEPSTVPNYFVVYRDEEDEVQFLATNAMTALLLSIIESVEGITFDNLCQQVIMQAPQFNEEQITQGALVTLNALIERGVIVTKNQD